MLEHYAETPRTATDAEIRKMAVEIVMFDEEERPGQRAAINLVDYLSPLTGPIFQRFSRQG